MDKSIVFNMLTASQLATVTIFVFSYFLVSYKLGFPFVFNKFLASIVAK